MGNKVKIPAQLRDLAGGNNELDIDSTGDLKDLLSSIAQEHPLLVERILDEKGEIRRFINVYVDEEDVRFLQGLQTPLPGSGVISILPAVAGG